MAAIRVVGIALGALLVGLQLCCQPARAAGRYYINFDKGNDTWDGLSPERAWRHAPGDRNAEGKPAGLVLHPGDSLLFAPGVRYRGAIKLNGGGNADHPVVITSAPGAGQAIIDGSDPVANVRPCQSADDCGGSPTWHHLVRADFGTPLPTNAGLFTEAGLLFPAQSPAPSDPFNSDNSAEYLKGDTKDLQQGVARLPSALAHALAGSGERRVVLELYANEIAIRDITALEGDAARFDPQGLRFNTDRPVRFAVLAHPSLVQRPGEFGLLPGGTAAVVYLPPGAKILSVALGRGGIDLSSQSFVQVRNLAFENMADDGTGSVSGIAIFKSAHGSDVTIDHNRFRNFRMPKGNGPLVLNFISRLTISHNDIEAIAFGSGMRLDKDIDATIQDNTISRIGRTGIMLIDMEHALVSGNTIADARGIHGNGLSVYNNNHDVRIVANTITAALRPITIGHGSPGVDNAMVFERNLIIGTADSGGALTSWGDGHGVTIRGNLLLGGKSGLDLSESDLSVMVAGNVMNGETTVKHRPYMAPTAPGYLPSAWKFSDNKEIGYDAGRKASAGDTGLKGAIADAIAGGQTGAWRQLCGLLPAGQSDSDSAKRIGTKLDCATAGPK